MMSLLRVSRMAIVAVGFLVASVLAGLSPAHAAEPTVTLRPGGALHARGAAVVVEATLNCPAGRLVQVGLVATQRQAGGAIVRGHGQRTMACTGAAITRRFPVSSADPRITGPSGRPFVLGGVFVTVSAQYCADRCVTFGHSRTVQAANVTMNAPQFTNRSLVVNLPAQGALRSAGAGVVVRIPYRCPAGNDWHFDGVLIERTSTAAVTSSLAGADVSCTGLTRTVALAFHAEASVWKRGSAFVMFTGSMCNDEGCRFAYAHRTLTLT